MHTNKHHPRRDRGDPGGRRLPASGLPLLVLMAAASVFAMHAQAPKASAEAIRPSPSRASENVPSPFHEGCMIGEKGTESHGCVYGDRHGKATVILFGDSHALMHFPALQAVADRNGWRLEVWTKRECTPAETTIVGDEGGPYKQCDEWRRKMLKRLGEQGPATVLVAGETKTTAVGSGGQALHGAADARALQNGYVATLRRIRADGDRPIVIEDTPEGPDDVAECVAADPSAPSSCDFPEPHRADREFELRAAEQVPGTRVIRLDSAICPGGVCRAVIGGILVYRDEAHITADFSRTLAPRFERALKGVVGQ